MRSVTFILQRQRFAGLGNTLLQLLIEEQAVSQVDVQLRVCWSNFRRHAKIRDALRALVPTNAQLHINLANGLLLNQKLEESIAEARKALALEDKSYAAHALLGRALIASGGDSKEANEHLQKSLDLYPDQTDLRFELVNALRKQKDFPAARVQLRILKDQLPPGDARLEYA